MPAFFEEKKSVNLTQNLNSLVLWLKDISKDDIALVGGKAANLGEMLRFGIPVPSGFVITSTAYQYFIDYNQLGEKINFYLKSLDVNDPIQLSESSKLIINLIKKSIVPKELTRLIFSFYDKLCGLFSSSRFVAVRSSATAEDLPHASFAGQQETFLNVNGEANLVEKVRECWASLFSPRAIFYRQQHKFDHFKVKICVVVQKMIQADKSGVMFTVDPIFGNKQKIIIEAIKGLGELIVQGSVTPDHYEVNKSTWKIIKKQINKQQFALIKKRGINQKIKLKKSEFLKQKISDRQIIELAKLGKIIQQHYLFPQDVEWAIEKNKIYITQTRPITTLKKKKKALKRVKDLPLPLLLKGESASPGIASGSARIIFKPADLQSLKKGEILVARMTSPDFVPAMKRASAIITDEGGQTSHAAIVSRELGIPCIVGTLKATKIIKNKMVLTIDANEGKIYHGFLPSVKKNIENQNKENLVDNTTFSLHTATKLYINLAEPESAAYLALKNVDGVGLLRAEFMISQLIKYHPKKLIEKKQEELFVKLLSQGIAQICQAFNPRPVIYRTTDFKTNEYANLIGGEKYEPHEANPFIGFRGAIRYLYNPKVFAMEIKAIKTVREKLNLKNLWLMLPFIRTIDELKKIKKILSDYHLTRSSTFKLYLMVEVPSNVILIEDFIKIGLDGVSIGSNDLTMLILGVDRDNPQLAKFFNENDPAVLWALERVIKIAKKNNIDVSICGQAPSLYPKLVEKLVNWGITSISVNPDKIEETRRIIYQAELKKIR